MVNAIESPTKFRAITLNIAGGMNTAIDPIKIPSTQWARILNFIYDKVGNLVLRNGHTIIAHKDQADGINSIGIWRKEDASNMLILYYGGTIGRVSGSSIVDIETGMLENKLARMESWVDGDGNNRLYIAIPGQDVKVLEDGNTIRNAGITAPTTAPTVAVSETEGVLDGTYKYAYSFLTSQGESSISPISDAVTPSDKQVNITDLPAGSKQLYRTGAGEEDLYQLAPTTETSFTDNLSDGVLGIIAPEHNDPPPQASWVKAYKNYMYYVVDSSFYYSKIGYPEIVEPDWHDKVFKDYENKLMAIEQTLNPTFIVMFYEKAIIAYKGTSPILQDTDPLVKLEINHSFGTKSPHTVTRANGDIIFLGSDKRVYNISRISLSSSETIEPQPLSANIEPSLQLINEDMLGKCKAVYDNNKYYLFVPTGTSTVLNKCFILDFEKPEKPWTEEDILTSSSAIIWRDASKTPIVVLGSSDSTKLYHYLEGTDDEGARINAELEYGKMHWLYPFNNKVFRQFRFLLECTEDYSFRITFYIIKNNVMKSESFRISGNQPTPTGTVMWGTNAWNVGQWTSNAAISRLVREIKVPVDIRNDGDIISFKITDIRSGSIFKFKGFELNGVVMRPQDRY